MRWRAAARGASLAAALLLAPACRAEVPESGDALRVELELREAGGAAVRRVERGASLEWVLTLHNPSAEPRRLLFPNAKTHDVAVETADGREVWRLSDGLVYIQILTEIELPARAEHVLRARFDVPADLDAGDYTARATVPAQSTPLEAPPIAFTLQ